MKNSIWGKVLGMHFVFKDRVRLEQSESTQITGKRKTDVFTLISSYEVIYHV